MDNTITISEIKRRGMAAITDQLRRGPVHIVKRNKRAAIILSEEAYQRLANPQALPLPGMTALQWLMDQSSTGNNSRATIDAELQAERSW